MSIGDLRRDYARNGLSESDLHADPIEQFRRWFEEACAAGIREPNAMTLATATRDGRPSARMVLLKGFDSRGFTFYTNYESRKGSELLENPWAALILFWVDLERQIRIEGAVEVVTPAESDTYFSSRPLESQLGSWASRQSQFLPDRAALERRVEELRQRYLSLEVPRPPYWGGFRVVPQSIEFWQGRPSRLHDRLRYRQSEPEVWTIERLSP
ncbi:MAG: pyridoxamine 5'-phosphate oxidase [Ktedonobacterales bacterium]